ncbi:MAG: shikimate kinase [Chloroflexi bacterium]|nr:MAG: shikimate kinase [Chloroflexota bacterium]
MKRESIILIGMAGVGKSTVGRSLAEALGFDFIDLDDYIEEKEGRTLQEIIDAEGEQAFLQIEKRRMHEIDLTRKVVAPGGSVIYHSDLMEYLKQRSTLVCLDDSFENIEGKLENVSARGIVGLKNKSLKQIYDERRPLYLRYADITLNCQGKSQDQIIREILHHYLDLSK